jgi:CRP-like cAMP-binding protein
MPPQERADNNILCSTISAHDLFEGLSEDDTALLAKMKLSRKFQPNSTVFAPGDSVSDIYVHTAGQAELFFELGGSRRVSACPVESNLIYGLVEALSGVPSEFGFQTVTAAEVSIYRGEEFFKFVKERPALSFRLAKIISGMYKSAVETIKNHQASIRNGGLPDLKKMSSNVTALTYRKQ